MESVLIKLSCLSSYNDVNYHRQQRNIIKIGLVNAHYILEAHISMLRSENKHLFHL